MIKRITLLLATLLAAGFFNTPVLAQDEKETATDSTQTTTETKPAEGKGGAEPECD